ncbi:hypothetical protein NQ318_005344 [Aromia moschata]|uniref:Methyltransferase HEMK2 n=1 Tax=Aromia moschata TaxID=1265417 RepID=A0AAV8YVY0_9CUCU|nr:hypothetical protein NQ318_005344 [Aromia moschata]
MALLTPTYNLDKYPEVYDPREDTFLLLDALEMEAGFLSKFNPTVVVEVGSGSGIVIAALAVMLRKSCLCMSTDINFTACQATKNTSILNDVSIECMAMDLLTCFKRKVFDVVVFNPPYVVTESEEITGHGLNRAWAGGKHGCEIINRLVFDLPDMLSDRGVCYMVLLKENKPEEIVEVMKLLCFVSEIVVQRRIPGEHLNTELIFFLDTVWPTKLAFSGED